MIQIKNVNVITPFCHPKLFDVLEWLSTWFPGPMVITSWWRPDDPGIHGIFPCRAVDLRSSHLPAVSAGHVADAINVAWDYGWHRPSKNVCVLHDIGQGQHFHIQASDETRRS